MLWRFFCQIHRIVNYVNVNLQRVPTFAHHSFADCHFVNFLDDYVENYVCMFILKKKSFDWMKNIESSVGVDDMLLRPLALC